MWYSDKMNRISIVLNFFLIFMMFFMSCAARITGSLQGDGQADLNINTSLEPRVATLIGRFATVYGSAEPGSPVLDANTINASMSAAPGIESVSFRNITPSAIEGPVKILQIKDFLASNLADSGGKTGGQQSNFINFEQDAGGGRCTISLSLDSGPEILSLISPDISLYLSALMAPLATGEAFSKAEYLSLVSTVYGRGIADEIAGAAVNASIDFPGLVQSVKGGTFSGRRAEFKIPLIDILVLETPLSYEVVWK